MLARLCQRLSFRLFVFASVAAALVWGILPDAPLVNEFRDVHHLFLYERSAVDTILRYGQLPLWNPYYCGGFDAVGAPQTRFVSPTLLLSLAFGAQRAEILTVFFFAIIGMEGVYRWLRLRVTSAAAATVIAPVFALSGQFTVAYYRGWIQFFGFQLVPWILFGVTLAARRRIAGVAVASIAFAWVLGFAGFFAAPMIAIAAALESLRAIFEQPERERGKSIAMLAATASFMAVVSCVRLWPVAETFMAAPRIMAGTPGHPARALLAMLVGPLAVKDGNTEMLGSFYVGPAFLALVALGGQDRRAFRALAIVLVMAWLAEGYARQPSLFGLMRSLPVFAALRYPERFLWLAILFASEPAAHALARVPLVGEGRRWRVLAWNVLGGAIAWTVAHQIGAFDRVAKERLLAQVSEASRAPEFRQSRGNRWLTVHVQSAGLGSLSCYETHRMPMSPLLRADLPAEEYLAPASAGAGTVARTSWSPNRIALRVDLQKDARVLVNQNWAPGWRASTGAVVSHEGLLAVDVPAGTHEVVLTFRPWSTMAGAGVSIAALAALAFLAWRTRRRGGDVLSKQQRGVTLAAFLSPWLVFGAAFVASPDPKWPKQPPTNPNRSPAVVAAADEAKALSGDVVPIGAKYAVPLEVAGGRVVPQDERDNLLLEVYLRRTGAIPRSTTMFVHLERRKDQGPTPKDKEDFYNADHQVVGGSFYLSDTPEGVLVRDAFGVHVGDKTAKGVWDVWVAFGHVSGRRGRVHVTDKGRAELSDERVKIGTFTVR